MSERLVASPWGSTFENCTVRDVKTIRAGGESQHPPVVLSALDQNSLISFVSFSSILLLPKEPAAENFVTAAQAFAAKYPLFCGRFRADQKHLEIECNNAGFPVTFAEWPEGSLASFPRVLTFSNWQASTPCRLPTPFFTDELNGFGAVFHGQPLFKIRLTHLGRDGGCVLAATVNHAVCDGAHLTASLVDLAAACRGERLQPFPGGLSRRLLTPEGLREAVPLLRPMLDEVVALSEAETEREQSFREAWNRIYGGQADSNIPFWPVDRSSSSTTLASVMLDIPRGDLVALKERASASHGGQSITTNDILIGLNWVLRCVVEGGPLPGQVNCEDIKLAVLLLTIRPVILAVLFEPTPIVNTQILMEPIFDLPREEPGSEADLGFSVVDIATNSFMGAMDHYFGNTVSGFVVKLPAKGDGSAAHADSDGTHEGDLFEAMCTVAFANRNALAAWRDGSGLLPFLERLVAPNRLEKEKQTIEALTHSRACIRSQLSNMLPSSELTRIGGLKIKYDDHKSSSEHLQDLAHCPNKVDFGTGGVKKAFGLFDRVTRYSMVGQNEKGNGAYWQAYLPGNFQDKLNEHSFLATLLPNSKLISYQATCRL